MKGVVLTGGKGSRLRPFTYSGAKQLVPIANTPVLHFPVHQLVAAGIRDIALVVGDTADQIRAAMGDGREFGARFTYLQQEAPLGLAHGLMLAREFAGGDGVVLYLGDNVLQGGIDEFVQEFEASGADGSVVLKAVDDPRAFGVAEMSGERLVRVIEKPAEPPSNLAVIGVYAFSSAVFDVIAGQRPSARGELEIADTISGLLAAGRVVTAKVTPNYWIDTGKMEDMLAANRVVLGDLEGVTSPDARLTATTLSGAVSIGEGCVLDRCDLRGPVAIAPGVLLTNCRVGPFVAIDRECVLEDVAIADAIVMEHTMLRRCAGIEGSMIGRFAAVCGAPAGSRLTLGDHSRFEAGA
jgi:glucose-1-phosphate thymidylyltransferase